MEIPWIKHELPQLEQSLAELNAQERESMNLFVEQQLRRRRDL